MAKAKGKMEFLLGKQNTKKAVATPTEVAPAPIGEVNDLLSGGFPYGKVSLIYGEPSTGKTTMAVQVVAAAMKKDPNHVCYLIPAERSENMEYYESLGLDLSRCAIMEQDVYFLEDVFQSIEDVLEDPFKAPDSIIIDSWDGMLSKKQMYTKDGSKKDMTEETVATKAAAGSRLWPRIKGLIGTRNTLFLALAQIRTSGIGGQTTFKTMSGGYALIHNSQLIISCEMKGLVRETSGNDTTVVGNEIKFTLKKSKVNTKTHQHHTVIYNFENSWDELQGLWVQALGCSAIEKRAGGWFCSPIFPLTGKTNPENKIRGEKATREFLRTPENTKALEKLVEAIRKQGKVDDGFAEANDSSVPVPSEEELPSYLDDIEDAFKA